MRHPTLGRYSFLAADPFDFIEVPADGSDALRVLGERLRQFSPQYQAEYSVRRRAPREVGRQKHSPRLPPFQGGAAGLFSYDLGRSLERLPQPKADEFGVPALAVGLYDVVVAFDHAARRAWIISQGFPEVDPALRQRRAAKRLAEARDRIAAPPTAIAAGCGTHAASLTTQYSPPGVSGVTSNFSRDGYLQAVRRVIEYIYAGDVFQVNLSQRLIAPARDHAMALYLRLRRCNPAPFAGYFDLGDFQIVSASPERFLRVADRQVETRPIKGTRPRSGHPTIDRAAEAELLASEKDRAENVMIVDLMRNDLTRVCHPRSVRVGQLCGIEAYEYVLHLVSSVHGRLRDDRTPLDLLRAAFPGGSVTGRRRFERWRSSPNWSRPPAARTAARWAISASTARWT